MRLRYKKPDADASQLSSIRCSKSSVLAAEKLSADFRFAASVAAFGQLLRGGKYMGDFGYDDVEALARSGLEQDNEGYRREFVSLVKLGGHARRRSAEAERVGQIALT